MARKTTPFAPPKLGQGKTTLSLQGIPCGSINEFNVGKALEKLKYSYRFQVPFHGGRSVRGGQVIDFIVETVPKPTPLYVQGTYWHRKARQTDDHLKETLLAQATRGRWREPIEILETQCETVEAALAALKEIL